MLLLLLPSAFAEPPAWAPVDSSWRVHVPAEGPLTVEVTWRFTSTRPGWWDAPLLGPELVVSEVTGPAVATPGGLVATLTPDATSATIVVRGTLDPSRPGAARLPVLATPRQHVEIDAPGLDAQVVGGHDGWLTQANALELTWRPHQDVAPSTPSPLTRAEAATAVWAESTALVSRTRARWRVLRGEVRRFELDVSGLSEVEASGANLAEAHREGDRLVLTSRGPVRGTFEVDVTARGTLPEGDVAAPAPRPVASRVERHWTVGRAEDGELVPVGGPRAVPLRVLPEWGRGLSETPIESAWTGDAPLTVRVARFTPMMGPDTVIERAEIVVAAAREGRALVRTTWDVRNERRAYLHVTPGPGMRPMTARVSGVAALVLSDGNGGLYVPLEKSVETVQGLLTFPVEITWMAEGEAWDPRGDRVVTVPAVDAPIQDARWQVYLPRGATAKGAHVAAPPPEEEAGAQELQQAVNAYKNNDFEEAQVWLEHARSSGNASANVERLQSNLDVLLSEDEEGEPEDVASRRVRSLAAAKTVTLQVEQEKKQEEAKRAYERGDVDEAEAALEEVIAISGKLAATEQKESAEQADKLDEANDLKKKVAVARSFQASTSSGIGAKGHGTGGGGTAEEPNVTDPVTGTFSLELGQEGGVVGGLVGGTVGPDNDRDGFIEGVVAMGDAPAGGEDEIAPTTATTTTSDAVRVSESVPGTTRDTTSVNRPVIVNESRIIVMSTTAKPSRGAARGPAKAPPVPVEAPPAQSAPPPPPAPEVSVVADELSRPEPAKPADGRAPLEVKAAPLTLALPLGGLLVEDRAALLPAGAAPTLTLRYHFTRDER